MKSDSEISLWSNKSLLRLKSGLGFFQVGRGRRFARQGGFVTGLGLVEIRQVIVRFDLQKQIALFDELAFLDRQQ